MHIYTDDELSRLLTSELKEYLKNTGYTGIIPIKKIDIIQTIKYKSPLYIKYRALYNEILDNHDENLTKEQKNVYKSLMCFILGIVEKNKIMEILNSILIPDISNIVVSKISYFDYPKIKDRIGLLLGGAGTGKTYLVSNILSNIALLINKLNNEYPYMNNDMDIHVLAPTNKAIKVIKSKISDTLSKNKINNNIINYWTISKFLQQEIEYTSEGKIKYKTNLDIEKCGYDKIKYIIIDEASMISRNNWDDLNRFIFQRLPHVRILLIGDNCQLPPVKEKNSVVFNIRLKRFKLDTIIRTKSKDITKIYNNYRISVENNTNVNEGDLISNDFKYIKSFKNIICNEFDVSNDKIISYSNDSVDKYNNLVRNIVFNNPEEKYVVNEKIIFGSYIKCTNINNSILEAKYRFYANDEATVNNVTKIKINTTFLHNNENYYLKKLFPIETFEVYKLFLTLDTNIIVTVYKVIDKDIEKFNLYFENVYNKIKEFSKNKKIKRDYFSKLWDIFYTIKNTINIPIKYSYALTVYKSQGSTFKKVFIDLEDIYDCVKDKEILNKTLYTSITRASDKIFYYKPTHIDYKFLDLEKYPQLKRYRVLEHKRAPDVLKNGQYIIYTKNEYQNKNIRKFVRCRVVNIINNIIYLGNSNFTWELKLKDDIIIYI
jgi:exodeoxyribonuclease-5